MTGEPVDILLVEDRPEDAEMAILALQNSKLVNTIHWVKDGEEALHFLFSTGPYQSRNLENPSLILLDLKLPKVSGLEVLAEIRKKDPTKRIPVVILTTSNTLKEVSEAYELGANSYIIKPVNFQKFSTTIDTIGHYWINLNYPPNKAIPQIEAGN